MEEAAGWCDWSTEEQRRAWEETERSEQLLEIYGAKSPELEGELSMGRSCVQDDSLDSQFVCLMCNVSGWGALAVPLCLAFSVESRGRTA